jgi:hypothetical protein
MGWLREGVLTMSERGIERNEASEGELRCDTCGRLSAEVKRVVLDSGYNRANARPLYNCPECYETKRRERDTANAFTAGRR